MNDTNKRYPAALTIAGSDSGGCAGIQADLKTFSSLGVFGTSVITAITAQNTCEVREVEVLSARLVMCQAEAVLDDIIIDAVKTGMLPSPEIIAGVASLIDKYRLKKVVVDPVMTATSGAILSPTHLAEVFRQRLYSRVSLITPNLPEAEALTGVRITTDEEVYKAGNMMLSQGCRAVLIKGGHREDSHAVDVLFQAGKAPVRFSVPMIQSRNRHGTGCTFSSAITSFMALGHGLTEAVRLAKSYISSAIEAGNGCATGQGFGPVNHFFDPNQLIQINHASKTKRQPL